MREWGRTKPSGPFANARRKEAASHRPQFTLAERKRIFQQMVLTELEAGILRYSRRRALQRYAEEIGIAPFDANLLIAEAQYRARHLDPLEIEAQAEFVIPPLRPREAIWPAGYKVAFALFAAAIIDLALIAWIVR